MSAGKSSQHVCLLLFVFVLFLVSFGPFPGGQKENDELAVVFLVMRVACTFMIPLARMFALRRTHRCKNTGKSQIWYGKT